MSTRSAGRVGSRIARRARATGAYPAAVLRALSRDRTALFFSLLLPVALIVIVGAAFGGSGRLDIGVVDRDRTDTSRAIVRRIEDHPTINATAFEDEAALRAALRRKEVIAGVVIPAGSKSLAEAGDQVPLRVLAPPDEAQGFAARLALEAAAGPVNAGVVARLVLASEGPPHRVDAAVEGATAAAAPGVEVVDVGRGGAALDQYTLTAAQNLVLFTFVTAMVSASLIVAARRHGVLHRSLSTPATVPQVLGGLFLAIVIVTVAQSLVILAVGTTVFGISWGDRVAAVALVSATCLAAAAAGVCIGAFGRNPDRTAALAPILGIALAVVGGCVIPLELFPPALESVAHAVPQFWSVRGWQKLLFDGAGLEDIVTELVVLLGVTVTLLAASIAAFSRELRHVRA